MPEEFVEDWENDEAEEDGGIHPPTEWRGSSYLQRVCIATHPALWKFRQWTTEKWSALANKSLPYILWEMRELRARGIDNQPTPFNDDYEVLEQFLSCSPKLRQMLIDILTDLRDPPYQDKPKVIVYTQFPRVAHLAHKLLGFCGIRSTLLTSKTKTDARHDVIKAFNEASGSEVLIAPFTIRLMGFTMHQQSRRVICIDQAYNVAVMHQAIKRVERIGQTPPTLCTRYIVRNTYMGIIDLETFAKEKGISIVDWRAFSVTWPRAVDVLLWMQLDRLRR